MSVTRYHITPLGPFSTPLRSDTLYGHLICAAATLDGAEGAESLIRAFESGPPPFVVSSAFPQGMLPMPSLSPMPRGEFRKLAGERREFKGELCLALEAAKRFKKQPLVPDSLLFAASSFLSQKNLFTTWLDDPKPFAAQEHDSVVRELEPHNSIHRMTGAVLDQGGFYLAEATWRGRDARLSIYVKAADRKLFERYLDYVADTGFGADRSTGKGHFAYERDETFDPAPFGREGNAHLSLSVCSATDLSGFSGSYDFFAKYGKAWSGFGERNPFKKPFAAFAEGAVFTRMPANGYVLRNIHPNPSIVQVVQPLTLPVTLEA
jgi:CRISPR-associated protein Csm4